MNGIKLVLLGFVVGSLALRALAAPQELELAPVMKTAGADFSVAPGEDGLVGMAAVLKAFEAATDWTLSIDDETQRLVEATRFFASGPIECAAEEAVRVVGALLYSQGYFWSVVRPEPPRVLAIRSLNTTARGTARQDAPFVPFERLAEYSGSAGLMIQTILTLPHADVRTLSNSMRAVVVDPNTLQIIPIGNSSQLVLQGFGPQIYELAIALTELDRVSMPAADRSAPMSHPVAIHGATGSFTLGTAGDERRTLLDLVQMHADATGQIALVDQETRVLLARQGTSLNSTITLNGDDFPVFCEELLRERGFVLSDLTHGAPCIYAVQSLQTTARGTARGRACYVDAASLASCARRPATMFITLIELPHVDVRTLSNSMRGLVVDPNLLQIVPIGNTNCMLVQARGRELVDLVEMFSRIEATAAEAAAQAPQPPAQGEPADEPDDDDE